MAERRAVVKDNDIDDLLKKVGQLPQELDPRLLESIAGSIKSSLRPVRPLPPAWMMTMGLAVLCAVISLAGAARVGLFGFAKMDLLERLLVFPVLGVLACLSANTFVHEMLPASRRYISPGALLSWVVFALLAVFVALFRDQRIDHFFSIGVVCLITGILHAVPAGLLSWMLLRRGFAVNPVAAGWVAGTLAGLAGVAMLELHCPNFQAAHILVWHTAVVPVSGALGGLIGWILRLRARLAGHS
jgi:hypothetical protein